MLRLLVVPVVLNDGWDLVTRDAAVNTAHILYVRQDIDAPDTRCRMFLDSNEYNYGGKGGVNSQPSMITVELPLNKVMDLIKEFNE